MGIQSDKREASAPWYRVTLSRAREGLQGDSALVPGLIFLALALGVGATGYYEYRAQAEVVRARGERDIGAIADVKTQQITQWLAERRAHASALMTDSSLASDVHEFLTQGAREDPVGARIRARLEAAQKAYGYEAVVLLDQEGRRHLVAGAVESLATRELELAGEALRRKDVVFSELHWDKSAGRRFVSLEVFAPLLLRSAAGNAAVGVIYLDADVSKDLYPLIRGWLTPGGSAEALLIRREGDEILYLNDLRHGVRASLSLRTPLDQKQQVGALALTQGEGTYHGLDYRGVEVVAAARSVPGTSWMMVARVDAAEVYAPITALATRVSVIVGVLVVIGGAGIGLWWRNQRTRNELEKHQLQIEKHALSMHYAHLTRYANDIILLMDEAARIVDANDRALEAYDYLRKELIGMPLADLQAPPDASGAGDPPPWTRDGRIYEILHRRRDGTVFPVEVSARIFEVSGKPYRQAIIRDITLRKRAEAALLRREQEYMALAEHSPDLIARFDRARRYLYVNAPIEAATGLGRAQFIGKRNAELGLPRQVIEPWERAIEATIRTAQEQRFDFAFPSPAGERHYEARMVPEFGPGGEVQTVLCVSRDVTAPNATTMTAGG
ncbi:MAG TPA: PAS domain S-box protein [Burkholderiales bacterium]|nr:PAS domain S-box protein [Burkholderiales bacterium]